MAVDNLDGILITVHKLLIKNQFGVMVMVGVDKIQAISATFLDVGFRGLQEAFRGVESCGQVKSLPTIRPAPEGRTNDLFEYGVTRFYQKIYKCFARLALSKARHIFECQVGWAQGFDQFQEVDEGGGSGVFQVEFSAQNGMRLAWGAHPPEVGQAPLGDLPGGELFDIFDVNLVVGKVFLIDRNGIKMIVHSGNDLD